MKPRYPEVQVQLTGEDGNAFAILGRVLAAMRAAGIPAAEREAYRINAMRGDYDHLLRVTMQTVEVK